MWSEVRQTRRALRLRVSQVFKQRKEVTVTAAVPLCCRHQSERTCPAVNIAGGTNGHSEDNGCGRLGMYQSVLYELFKLIKV